MEGLASREKKMKLLTLAAVLLVTVSPSAYSAQGPFSGHSNKGVAEGAVTPSQASSPKGEALPTQQEKEDALKVMRKCTEMHAATKALKGTLQRHSGPYQKLNTRAFDDVFSQFTARKERDIRDITHHMKGGSAKKMREKLLDHSNNCKREHDALKKFVWWATTGKDEHGKEVDSVHLSIFKDWQKKAKAPGNPLAKGLQKLLKLGS